MAQKKTLEQRQQELRALLATPEGQEEIRVLESRYQAASQKPRAARASVITYILVHERTTGIIVG